MVEQSAVPVSPEPEEQRRERYPVRIGAGVRKRSDRGSPASVYDISPDGFRAETMNGIAPGTSIWLKLRGLDSLLATVIWCDGYVIGCKFDAPLHEAVVARIVALNSAA